MKHYFFVRYLGNDRYDVSKSEYKVTPITSSLKKCKKDAYYLLTEGFSRGKEIQIWWAKSYSYDLKDSELFRIVRKVEPSPRKNLVSITILNAVGQPEFYLHKDGTEGGLVDYSKIRANQKKKKKKVAAPFGL